MITATALEKFGKIWIDNNEDYPYPFTNIAHLSKGDPIRSSNHQTLLEHNRGVSKYASSLFINRPDLNAIVRLAAKLHDIGKYSFKYTRRMIETFIGGASREEYGFMHQAYGAWFVLKCLKGVLSEPVCRILVASIIGHHRKILNFSSVIHNILIKATEGDFDIVKDIALREDPEIMALAKVCNKLYKETDIFAIEFDTRMVYAALIDGDFLDTERFMSPTRSLERFYSSDVSMDELLCLIEKYVQDNFKEPKSKIDNYRNLIYQSVISKTRYKNGYFMLPAPTGFGKTISSIVFAIRHAIKNKMDRIIVVLPYINIINQNANVLREIFGEHCVLESHSAMFYKEKGEKSWAENNDAPIIVTTMVNFCESMYSNRPGRCRKNARNANAVIIFDEAQNLPYKFTDIVISGLNSLVTKYHSSVLFTTATMPSFDEKLAKKPITLVNKKIRKDISTNFKRVDVTWPKSVDDILSYKELASLLDDCNNALCVFNTRQQVRNLLDVIGRKKDYVFVLTTFTPKWKAFLILEEIKNRLERKEKVILISTQLVESGQDISFENIFRAMGPLTAIGQSKGRGNRHGEMKTRGKMRVFIPEEGIMCLPGDTYKIETQATISLLNKYNWDLDPTNEEIINEWYQMMYFSTKKEVDKIYEDIQKDRCNFYFDNVKNKIRFIEDRNATVFVPKKGDKHSDIIEEELAKSDDNRNTAKIVRMAARYSISMFLKYKNIEDGIEYTDKLVRDGSIKEIGPLLVWNDKLPDDFDRFGFLYVGTKAKDDS